jgi:hypothetical protein
MMSFAFGVNSGELKRKSCKIETLIIKLAFPTGVKWETKNNTSKAASNKRKQELSYSNCYLNEVGLKTAENRRITYKSASKLCDICGAESYSTRSVGTQHSNQSIDSLPENLKGNNGDLGYQTKPQCCQPKLLNRVILAALWSRFNRFLRHFGATEETFRSRFSTLNTSGGKYGEVHGGLGEALS